IIFFPFVSLIFSRTQNLQPPVIRLNSGRVSDCVKLFGVINHTTESVTYLSCFVDFESAFV
ncbi:MAG: hypothetical protein VYD83_03840, partial [SAR324 cluster bacterium]|nr:hypothetical protein [SAR324 cluster bacterium]